jgi:hypothetical protein
MRTAAVARIAAAIVSVALSGAPRVVAAHAPPAAHRCACRAGANGAAHQCDCAICRTAALAAQASDGRLPPCHRAAARRALSRERSAPSPGSTCLEGTCGGPGETPRLPAGLEPFFPPRAPAVAGAARVESIPSPPAFAAARALEPDVPPPRTG